MEIVGDRVEAPMAALVSIYSKWRKVTKPCWLSEAGSLSLRSRPAPTLLVVENLNPSAWFPVPQITI